MIDRAILSINLGIPVLVPETSVTVQMVASTALLLTPAPGKEAWRDADAAGLQLSITSDFPAALID